MRYLICAVACFLTLHLWASSSQSKIQKTVSVKSFGAKGNGINDDADAIINAVNSDAVVIVIPPGTYLISKTLSFKQLKNKTIRATGAVIKNINATAPTLLLDHGDHITIIGGQWTRSGNLAEGLGNEHTFLIVGVRNITVSGVFINGSPEMGINLSSVINGNIINNKIINCFRDGIYAHYSVNLTYSGNYLENIKDDAMSMHDYGLDEQKQDIITVGFKQAGNSKIINNVVKNAYSGFSSIGCTSLVVSGNKITNTVNAGISIFNSTVLYKGSTARVKNIALLKNTLINCGGTTLIIGKSHANGGQYGNGRAAIFVGEINANNTIANPVTRLTDINIQNNIITNSFVNGIYIALVDGLVFKNNSFKNCFIDKSDFCGFIVEITDCTNASINGNKVIDTRAHPLHKAGYLLHNTQGSNGTWAVQGHTDPADHYVN
jgi:hypothetical protein